MKKSLQLIGLLLLLTIISACQSDTEQEVNNQNDESGETTQENESDIAGDVSEEPDNETAANENADSAYEYEEQEVIEGQIEEGTYDVIVETDNPGSRVMFYEINGEKYYKTVFVKEDNRLKIIDIQNDEEQGLIYNDII
ncbi:hypothetical protein [Oceanobacillus locisalsi]|uniref:PepSY domain-containing protein n=1 Tax=Oceanobacillus locisalsi TaxID=546107 RepID=A0ABW3NDL0_9BACI